MFTESDYEKLHQIMAESPEKEELLTRLLHSHRMDISTISHEIRNPLTLIYSTLQMIEASNPEVLNIRHWSDLHSDIEYMKHYWKSYQHTTTVNVCHLLRQISTSSSRKFPYPLLPPSLKPILNLSPG